MDSGTTDFAEMLRSIRAGEPAAVGKFVAAYEPFLRRSIRFRLARTTLRAAADSVDVCQSVLGSFLVRLTAGEYEILDESDLRKLLVVIAQKKFLALQRRELASKRDRRMTISLNNAEHLIDHRLPTPESSLSHTELLARFESCLSADELHLYTLRRQGISWNSIAEEFAESAVVLRKRLSRAVKRVALELGIEDSDEFESASES